ncbi:MAG: 3-keto-disaccharide hydrolase [Henriciella sp.]
MTLWRNSLMGVVLGLGACVTAPVNATAEPLSLFDGETLEGWRVTTENPSSFRVEDGAIVAEGPRAHLFYEGEHGADFTEFELSLKVKTRPGANSGVYFHTAYQDQGWPRIGLEAQVNATQSDFRKTGSVYAIADVRVYAADREVPVLGVDSNAYVTRAAAPHADDEWFDYTIRVEDGTVSTRVNGELLVTWTQPEDWPDEERRLSSGTFGLQAHDPDSTVYYKDIRVTRLD